MVKSKFISPVLASSAVICAIGGNFSSAMEDEKQAIELEKECKQEAADAILFREFVKMIGGVEGTQEFNVLLEEVRKIGKKEIGKIILSIYNAKEDEKEILKKNAKKFVLSNSNCVMAKKMILNYAKPEQLKALFEFENSKPMIAFLENPFSHFEDKCKKFFEVVSPDAIEKLLQYTPADVISTLDPRQIINIGAENIKKFLENIGAEKDSEEYSNVFKKLIETGTEDYQKIYNFIDNIEKNGNKYYNKDGVKEFLYKFLSSDISTDKIKSLFNCANEEQLISAFNDLIPDQLVAILNNINVKNEEDVRVLFQNVKFLGCLRNTPMPVLYILPLEKLIAIARNYNWPHIVEYSGSDYVSEFGPSKALQIILNKFESERLQKISEKDIKKELDIEYEDFHTSVWDNDKDSSKNDIINYGKRIDFTIANEQDNIS